MTSESGPPDFEHSDLEHPGFEHLGFEQPEFEPPGFLPPGFERSSDEQSWGEPSWGEHEPPPAAFPHSLAAPPVSRPAQGRRALIIVLVAVATVLVVLVAADRIAPRLIGDRVAGTLQKELGSSQRPVVRFAGFPFLTQVATRHYQRITITAREVPVSGTGGRLLVKEFDGTLTQVRPDPSYRTIAVGHFAGSATISYSSLTRFVGTTVSYDTSGANGRGFVTMTLGGDITVTGKPALDVRSNQLYLARTQFRIAGQAMPAAPPGDLTGQLFRFPLPEMLAGTQLNGVRARPNGLVLTGSGDNLTLRR